MQDMAAKVLYDQNDSMEDKARKLFFLDQLNKPAPPIVPPHSWEAQVCLLKSQPNRKKLTCVAPLMCVCV